MNVYVHNFQKQTPSNYIAVQFQLHQILGQIQITDHFEAADVIIGSGQQYLEWVPTVKQQLPQTKFILYKPHQEVDIRIKNKNWFNSLKTVLRRLTGMLDYRIMDMSIYNYYDLIIADNYRLLKLFEAINPNTVYLPQIYFDETALPGEFPHNSELKIGFFGEATHLSDIVSELEYLDKKIQKKITLIYFGYGLINLNRLQKRLANIHIKQRSFSFDYLELTQNTRDIDFTICSHKQITSNYNQNSLIRAKNQPNEVSEVVKFSANTGRNHLSALLGIPFVTHNIIELADEFPWLTNEYYFENGSDLLWFINNFHYQNLAVRFDQKNQSQQTSQLILKRAVQQARLRLKIHETK